MDYDIVMVLTFVVFAVIIILAILPRAGDAERLLCSPQEVMRAAQRDRARRRRL
jgi:hypothetical protein